MESPVNTTPLADPGSKHDNDVAYWTTWLLLGVFCTYFRADPLGWSPDKFDLVTAAHVLVRVKVTVYTRGPRVYQISWHTRGIDHKIL